MFTMGLLIHVADISNTAKPWKICYRWIEMLFNEFYAQGDKVSNNPKTARLKTPLESVIFS